MPDKKISQLTAGTTIADTDLFVYVNGGVTKKITFADLVLLLSSFAYGMTAHAGGGQTSALSLSKVYNRVDFVATDGDSCKLTHAYPGSYRNIQNEGLFDLYLYPLLGETFKGYSTNAPLIIASKSKVNLFCYSGGTWTIV